MPISDRYRSASPSSSSVVARRTGGLSARYASMAAQDDPTKELDSRITNATTRLREQGKDIPEEEEHKGIFQRLLDALNYLNNKKNQGLWWATHGGSVYDVPEEVTGQELLRDWTGGDFKGSGAAGFGFDVITDPLNLLSFGTAGAASQVGKAAARGISKRYGALQAGGEISRLSESGGNQLTQIFTAATKEGAGKNSPRDGFLQRLLGREGETLRDIQSNAERIAKERGLPDYADITPIERELAAQKGLKLEDLYRSIYREGTDVTPNNSVVNDLPIDETAPKPWKISGYAKAGKVEEVSVDWLSQIKGNPLRHDEARMKQLEDDIRENGFKEPILLMFGQQDRKIRLGEGNHRLEIAKRLGYKYVPVRVMRQQKIIDGGELAGESMSKVPVDGYFKGDARPSEVFDSVEIRPITNSADEIASAETALIPPPEDFSRAGPPGSIPPGSLGGLTDQAVQGSNKWFAQLGGHLPFTDIGGYWKIPGSEQALSALGNVAGKALGGVGKQLAKIPGAPEAGKAVKDLIGRNFKVGYGVAGEINQLTQRTAELIRMDNKDIVDNMVILREKWKQAGYTPGGQDDLDIIKALEDPTHLNSLRPDQQEIAKTVRDFFDIHYMKAVDNEVIEDFTANYIPHIFKGKASVVADALEVMRRSGARLKTKTPNSIDRVLDMPLTEILADPKLAARLKPETDIIKIMAIYKSSLEKAIRNKDMLENLVAMGPDVIRKEKYQYNNPKTGKLTEVMAQIPDGWVRAPITQLKGHWVPPEIADHLKDTIEPFINNIGFKKLAKHYDEVLGWWKGMATVPNLGFQIRNQMGNMFNNYLAGVRTLDNYLLARQVQGAEDTAMDYFYDIVRLFTQREAPHTQGLPSTYSGPPTPGAFGVAGPDFDTALLDRVFNSNRLRARFFEGDGPKIKVVWDGKERMMNVTGIKFLAKFHGVTGLGYYGADLGEETLKKLDRTGGNGFQRWNPLSTRSWLFEKTENLGNYLEDNARLAHFISKLKTNGGNLEEAATSVKKYLFDYSKLTPTEKGFMKRFMPFYAFTRNNLPLQLRELVKQPKYAAMAASYQNFMDHLSEEATDTEMDRGDIPKFISSLYSVRLPFQIGSEERDVMAGFDLPIRDLNSISPSEWVSMITPLLTVPIEQFANRNFYTKRDIEAYDGETTRAPGYMQGLFNLFQMAEPDDPEANIFNQAFTMFGMTVATDDDGNPELRLPTRVVHLLDQIVFAKNAGKAIDFVSGDSYDPFNISSMLTGTSAVSSTEQQRETNSKYNQLQALEDMLRKLKDEGSPVPTLREIQQGDPAYRLKQILGGR